MPTPHPRQPQPAPLPPGSPRHARAVTPARPDDSGGTSGTASSSRAPSQALLQQRLQGAFLTIIGLAGLIGGVLFSIEAPRFTPVPVVFLTFWLVMVIVGKVLFAGLGRLRDAGVGAPAPSQVRAAAAVAGIVVAVGMMGFAATGAGAGVAAAAPCPGGGPATCGPTGPDLTFAPPTGQATAPGQQPGQQGGQDQQGIATSPSQGGDNGPGIQAQTPQFGTPGQQAPNIPGNEQPGQGGQQQPAQGQQTGQQGPVQTTAPGGPQRTGQQQPGQQTQSGQPSSPTVTVTKTESQCAVPGAGNGAGTPGSPGGGDSSSNGGGTGPDNGGGENQDGAPSWAYLVGEASALMTGRRRPGSGSGQGPSPTDVGEVPAAAATDAGQPDAAPAPEQLAASEPMETQPGSETVTELIDSTDTDDGGSTSNTGEGENESDDDTDDSEGETSSPFVDRSADDITKEYDDDHQVLHTSLEEGTAILRGTPLLTQPGPYTPQQQADRTVAAQAAQQQAATERLTGPMRDAIAQAQGTANPVRPPLDTTDSRQSPDPVAPLTEALARTQDPDAPTDGFGAVLAEKERREAPVRLQQAREAEQARQRRIAEAPTAWDKFFGSDAASLRDYFLDDVYPVGENTVQDGRNYVKYVTMSDGSQLVIRGRDGVNPFTDTTLSKVQVTGSPILGDADLDVPNGKASPTPGTLETLLEATDAASWAAVVVPGGGLARAGAKAATKAAQKAFVQTLERKIAEGATAAVAKREAQSAARQAAKEALEQAEKRATAAAAPSAAATSRAATGTPSRTTNGYPTPRSIVGSKGRPGVTSDVISAANGSRLTKWGDGGWVRFNPLNGRSFTGVQARITKGMLGQGSTVGRGINPPGWSPGKAWPGGALQRGHGLARILGGSGRDARNLFTTTKRANDEMQAIERQVIKALDKGPVNYAVSPIFGNGPGAAPTQILVRASGSGLPRGINRVIQNIP